LILVNRWACGDLPIENMQYTKGAAMDQAERKRYLEIIQSTPDNLKSALKGVPKKLLVWRPAPGKWSIHEIVCHMRDAERNGYLVRYGKILAEDNPTLPDVDPDKLVQERQYDRMDLREVVRDWRAARRETLAVLRKVTEQQWGRVGTHPSLGPMSLEAILMRQATRNDEGHLAQIETIKKRRETLSRLEEFPRVVASLLKGVSDETLRRKPAPDTWSMLEILCHLRDVDRFFVERYAKVANHDRPALRVFNQDELATLLKYNQEDPASVLREFRALRAEVVALLYALAPQSWQRIGVHPKRGEFSIAAAADHHLSHDSSHANRIRELREQFGLA
jgi:uncharacterized damage-inducible protein DinB